jgi:hypothetical protein
MGKLSDDEIRKIVQKASLLEKFGEEGSSKKLNDLDEEIKSLYEITDEIGIPRRFVYEAYVEHSGIPVQEPLVIDNNDFNSTEIVGFAKGSIDKELFNELKGQAEYHFNTLGTVTRRRDKIIWKAKPVGPSKFIASSNSPEVEFEKVDGNTKIKVSQSLKTLNKLYIAGILAAFAGFMMFAGVVFDQAGSDTGPIAIFSGIFLLSSFLYTRFVNGRKRKRKKNLQEFVETLQGKIERHLKSTINTGMQESDSAQIEIPENDYEEDIEVKSNTKIKE